VTQVFVEQTTTQLLGGKHALVTGGAHGIGAAVTQILLAHGARVTMLGRNEDLLEEAVRKFSPLGEIGTAAADITEPKAIAQAFATARQCFGGIEILVNNAGEASSAPFLKTDLELWRRMMAVNLDGTFHCIQASLPGMLSAGWGRIINMASIAGLVGGSYISAYCAAKHGVIGLTRALAVEVAAKGITVNAVCPGYTEGDMFEKAVTNIVAKTGRTPEAARAELLARNPQKRLVQPMEAANAVAWLCLPGSDAVTGQAITVAGGEVM